MKRLVRWVFRLLILAIVLLVALVLLKDTLFKALAEWRIRQQTGLSVTIRKLDVGLLSPTFTMEGFKLYNPPEFGGSALLDVPEVHFEYDPWEIRKGSLHLKLLRFNLGDLNLVKNKSGQTNIFAVLDSLNRKQPAPAEPRQPGGSTNAAPAKQLQFGGIDRLYLSLGTVRFTDQAQPTNGWVRQIGWKDYEVKNIRTAEDARNWAMLLVLRVAVSPVRISAPAASRN